MSQLRSLEEAISEVQRELDVRSRCYPRWISEGKFSAVEGRDRLERLQSALTYLKTRFADDENNAALSEVVRTMPAAGPVPTERKAETKKQIDGSPSDDVPF